MKAHIDTRGMDAEGGSRWTDTPWLTIVLLFALIGIYATVTWFVGGDQIAAGIGR